jgi:hypothetical protein
MAKVIKMVSDYQIRKKQNIKMLKILVEQYISSDLEQKDTLKKIKKEQ